MTKPTILHETPEEYHSKKEFLSSGRLKLFRRGPIFYKLDMDGEIPAPDSEALAFGDVAHTLILEGQKVVEDRYVLGGPVNERTNREYGRDTHAWAKFEKEAGKPAISIRDWRHLAKMAASVDAHPVAHEMLKKGDAECVVRGGYCGQPCQIRIDFLGKSMVDLKTTRDIDYFPHDAYKYDYVHQAAFYQEVWKACGGEEMPFYFLVVEKVFPYRTGVFEVLAPKLNEARIENERAIGELAECQKDGYWPTLYEEILEL